MKAKIVFGLLGIGALVAASWVYYAVGARIAIHYNESNATWRIRGHCINAQTGVPIANARITASFTEPVAFKHHWRKPPPLKSTEVVIKTDSQGQFEVIGEGGSAYITAKAEGYNEPEPWENWRHYTRDGVSRVDTNLTLSLKPRLNSTRQP